MVRVLLGLELGLWLNFVFGLKIRFGLWLDPFPQHDTVEGHPNDRICMGILRWK